MKSNLGFPRFGRTTCEDLCSVCNYALPIHFGSGIHPWTDRFQLKSLILAQNERWRRA